VGEPLTVRECLRVVLGMLAVALLGVWMRLEIPEEVYDAEPAAYLRLARLADPDLNEAVPLLARFPLPDAAGQAMVHAGGLGVLTANTLVAALGGFLGGLALWGFLRSLCGRPLPAFAATVIVLMQPWRTTLATDPSVAWLLGPSLALAGVAWIGRGGGIRASLLAGFGFATCGWTAFDQLPVTLLGGAVLLLAHVPLMRRPFPSGEPVSAKSVLGATVGAALLAAALLAPAFWSGLPAQPTLSGAAAAGWLGADGAMQMLGVKWSAEGHHFYWPVVIGWLVFGLLAWVAMNVRDPRLRPWWCTLLAAFLLLQGSRLNLFGHEVERVVMPHAWFASVPGFESLSSPAAWLPLFGIAMAAVLALGLREWQVQHGRAATFLLAAFTAFELRPEPVDAATPTLPAVYSQMAQADEGAVLELPLTPANAAALWQGAAEHRRPVVLADALNGAEVAGEFVPKDLLAFLLPGDPAAGDPMDEEEAARALDAIPAETLAAWRRWLEDTADVRWIVLRHAPDVGVRATVRVRSTWLQRFKREITPWSFNPLLHEERVGIGRQLAAELREESDRSIRARVLFERWYGAPDSRQGSPYAAAWNLNLLAEQAQPVEAAAGRAEAAVAAPARAAAPARTPTTPQTPR
jgi:hypothetical protein